MPEDRVLRCRIPVKLKGLVLDQVFDAVEAGGFYNIVLEWGEDANGLAPRVFIPVAREHIEPVCEIEADCELLAHVTLDLDCASITDLPQGSEERFFPRPQ
ncbi:hypothetical protein GCM10023213_49120 [Prosthecobacter algae]|uniref:Uncharacterized protein n=1 Tax=Prosthecobacter algae TaxID=1144682 RepID=A0ABP9PQF3_9BACT